MITIIEGLLASKYGRMALEALVVLALVFGAYKWAEHKGREAQQEKDAQKQEQLIEQGRQADQKVKDQLVSQANLQAAAAQAAADQARAQFAALASNLSKLKDQAVASTQQVAKLPDSELHQDITSKLAIRPAGDPTPGYLAAEERAIDTAVTQLPILQGQNGVLASEVQQKDHEAQAEAAIAAAKAETIAAQTSYITRLEQDYKQLYNLHAPRTRSVKCLYLWSCGKKELK